MCGAAGPEGQSAGVLPARLGGAAADQRVTAIDGTNCCFTEMFALEYTFSSKVIFLH